MCQGQGDDFSVGFVRGNGQVELKRYVGGEIFESASPATLPDDLLKSGQGEANELELTCVPSSSSPASTRMTFSVNGEVVKEANTSAAAPGLTGFFVEDQAGGTDCNFEDYEVSVPER